jgi:hypothetical protein
MANENRYIKKLIDGYQVVIPRMGFSRFIAFGDFSDEQTHLEAIRHRDLVLKAHGQMSLLDTIPHINARQGNSPLAGVFLCTQARDTGQKPKAFFAALWKSKEGIRLKKTFGIAKMASYEDAFFAAAAWRIKHCNLDIDLLDLPLPSPTHEQYALIHSLAVDVPLPA